MLTIHDADAAEPQVWKPGTAIAASAAWLDLCNATPEEVRACEDAVELQLPRREEIVGFGFTGRNRSSRRALFLQISNFSDAAAGNAGRHAAPVSLVLTPKLLVTARYAQSETFDSAARDWRAGGTRMGAASACAELLETMAERTAQSMQEVAGKVADLSAEVFGGDLVRTHRSQRWLVRVGKLEAQLAGSRGTLLGLTRLVEFVCDKSPRWLPSAAAARIAMVRNDVAALDRFDEQLTGKLQFLLDAIFGFISVNQNNVMKLFTVVSVVAVPPVILAGIWGMNFKAMPELDKPWGYVMALSAIAFSIIIPLAIFKWRGWLSND